MPHNQQQQQKVSTARNRQGDHPAIQKRDQANPQGAKMDNPAEKGRLVMRTVMCSMGRGLLCSKENHKPLDASRRRPDASG